MLWVAQRAGAAHVRRVSELRAGDPEDIDPTHVLAYFARFAFGGGTARFGFVV